MSASGAAGGGGPGQHEEEEGEGACRPRAALRGTSAGVRYEANDRAGDEEQVRPQAKEEARARVAQRTTVHRLLVLDRARRLHLCGLGCIIKLGRTLVVRA